MAKFCTKCGNPLVDGQPCTCLAEKNIQTKTVEVEVPVVDTEEVKKVVRKVVKKNIMPNAMNAWQVFLTVLREPVTSMSRVGTDANFVNGAIINGVEVLTFALGVCAMISSIIRSVYSGIRGVASQFGAQSYVENAYSQYVNIPYFQIFLRVVLVMLISKLIFNLISMATLKFIGGADLSLKSIFPATAAFSSLVVVANVVWIVISLMSPIASLVFYSCVYVYACITLVTSITAINGIKKNRCAICLIIILLVSFFVMSLLTTSFLGDVFELLNEF